MYILKVFWQRVCDLMSRLSSCMLRINQEPRYFTELFYELKSHANIVSIVQSATVSAAVASDQTSTPTIPKSITINAFSNHHNNANTNNVLSAYNQSSINSLSREKFYKQQQQQQPLMMTQNLVSTFSSTVQPRCCYNSQFCDHHGAQHHVMSHPNHHQRHRASDLGPKPIAAYCI